MNDLPIRLATAITTLLDKYNLRPDGPYAGLSFLDSSIIQHLGFASEPVIQGVLGQQLGLPKTTMTSAVRRLEQRKLLRKDAHPEDARARTLLLTKEANGSWRFLEQEGKTKIDWTYTFTPTNFLTRPILAAIIYLFWRPYMTDGMSNVVSEIEA